MRRVTLFAALVLAGAVPTAAPTVSYRVLVSTDLGGDPDDIQSLYRLVHYSDVLRVEGIVSSPGPGAKHSAALVREWIPKMDVERMRAHGHPELVCEADLLATVRQRSLDAGGPAPERRSEGSDLIAETAIVSELIRSSTAATGRLPRRRAARLRGSRWRRRSDADRTEAPGALQLGRPVRRRADSRGLAAPEPEPLRIGGVRRAPQPLGLIEANADRVRGRLRIRMVCGDQDSLFQANVEFQDLAAKLKTPVEWVAIAGVAQNTRGLYVRVGLESRSSSRWAYRRVAPHGERTCSARSQFSQHYEEPCRTKRCSSVHYCCLPWAPHPPSPLPDHQYRWPGRLSRRLTQPLARRLR
jgi:hypothetical protein